MKMAKEEGDSFSLLSLKDFEERGIKIDSNWTGLDALAAVASLASHKLEEERIRKENQKKPAIDHHQSTSSCRFAGYKVFECGSSSREKPMETYSKNNVAVFGHGNFPSTSDPWGAWLADQRLKEKALKKPVIIYNDLCSKKPQGFYDNAPKKLMGDAMKARIRFPIDWGDGDDDDWVVECTKQKKEKRKLSQHCSRTNKKPKIVLDEIPDLPQEFKERIQQLNGSKVALVIQKDLFSTDVSDHHYRLSIPWNQIISKDFLTDEEKAYLENTRAEMKVKLIEPSLQECEMTFKRWVKPNEKNCKERAKSSFSYVLINKWNQLKARNNLKLGDTIQLWKFRSLADELCLALVLVDLDRSKVCEANSSKNLGDINGANKDGSSGSNNQSSTSGGTGSTTTQLSHEGELE